jgi:hypothetical protein
MSVDGSQIITLVPKRIRVIPFNAVLPAGSNVTILAGQISFRYRIVEVEIVFQDDANSQLLIYVLVSKNSNLSTTTVPPDYNIFSEYASTPYIIGEGLIKNITCSHQVEDGEVYIKVYASNLSAWAQVVNVTVKIEEV